MQSTNIFRFYTNSISFFFSGSAVKGNGFTFGNEYILLRYTPTPVQEITGHPSVKKAGIRLLIKREDLNHPRVSGNKWWKLKYNLAETGRKNHDTILTFGGAYSNHIYATAAAAAELKLKSIGIIRGEETIPLNSTLAFALKQGMQIHYVSRALYRDKSTAGFIETLRDRFGEFFLIPEGGSNLLAVKGCAEYSETVLSKVDFDHLVVPSATGGTLAGLICGSSSEKNIIGVSVLKGGDFLVGEVNTLVKDFSRGTYKNWSLLTAYDQGGYAKITSGLSLFIEEMKSKYGLPLDPVYTGKLLWAVIREIEAGSFKRGSSILVLHTGGLQITAE